MVREFGRVRGGRHTHGYYGSNASARVAWSRRGRWPSGGVDPKRRRASLLCVRVYTPATALMDRPPDFFMSTAGEYEPLAAPRVSWEKARLRDVVRDDHMLIEIEPGLAGQRFGLGSIEIVQLIISARHRGRTLYPISEWPLYVYVARIPDRAIIESLSFTREQIELIAWGTLFRTREEASDHAQRFQR